MKKPLHARRHRGQVSRPQHAILACLIWFSRLFVHSLANLAYVIGTTHPSTSARYKVVFLCTLSPTVLLA